jgi:hypothetical protein
MTQKKSIRAAMPSSEQLDNLRSIKNATHVIDLIAEMEKTVAILQQQVLELSASEDEEYHKLIPSKGKTATMFRNIVEVFKGMVLPCPACASLSPADDATVRPCDVCDNKGFLKLRKVEGYFSRLSADEISQSA